MKGTQERGQRAAATKGIPTKALASLLIILRAYSWASHAAARACDLKCARCTRALRLRGGSGVNWLSAERDDLLTRKRRRAAGISFQTVVDTEGAGRYFSPEELQRLRRQFAEGEHGREQGGDIVPVGMLAELRMRISIKRDKISRSLITGEPISVSDDDGLGNFGTVNDANNSTLERGLQAAKRSLPTKNGGSSPTSRVEVPDRARKHVELSKPGVSVIDGGLWRAPGAGANSAMLNYNPSLLGEDGPAATPPSNDCAVGAQSGSGHGVKRAATAEINAHCVAAAPSAASPNETIVAQQPAQESDRKKEADSATTCHRPSSAGASAAGRTAHTNTGVTGGGEYVGWVGASLVPQPGGSRLAPAEGICELVRVSGQLQVVSEEGVVIGCVEPRQAKPLVTFLRSSVPPGSLFCVCKRLKRADARSAATVQLEIVIYGPPDVHAAAERILSPSPLQTNIVGHTGFVGSTAARPMEDVENLRALVNRGPSVEDWDVQGEASVVPASAQVDREAEERELQSVLDLRPTAAFEPQMDDLFDKGVRHDEMPELEAPPSVHTRLLLHQRKALHWMVSREEPSKPMFWEPYFNSRTNTRGWFNTVTRSFSKMPPQSARGGMLADEMGLGKTLSVISLVMRGVAARRKLLEGGAGGVIPLANATGPTLIVSPLSVLQTWVDQLQEHTDGSLRLYIYHGSGRTREPLTLMLYDVVLTTYSILGTEFIPESKRDAGEAASVLHAVRWSRVVLDEAHLIANRNSLQSKAVVALSSVARWAVTGTPIQNKLEDLFPIFAFLRLHPLDNFDFFQKLVIAPMRQRSPASMVRIRKLLQIFCLRRTKDQQLNGQPIIILPTKTIEVKSVHLSPREHEAYRMLHAKGRELVGKYLSNQREHGDDNNHRDSYAKMLLLLLRLRQFCDHPSLVANSLDLNGGGGGDFNTFRALLEDAGSSGVTGVTGVADAEENEGKGRGEGRRGRWKSNSECVRAVSEFCEAVVLDSGGLLSWRSARSILLSACPLMSHKSRDQLLRESARAGSLPSGSSSCKDEGEWEDHCLDTVEIDASRLCDCMMASDLFPDVDPANKAPPQVSQGPVGGFAADRRGNTTRLLESGKEVPLADVRFESAKVAAVMAELKNKTLETRGEKTVVFSQFARFLDVLEGALQQHGVRYTRLDGSMSRDLRGENMRRFHHDASITVLLATLKSGGMGLNLVVANNVLLTDPWWNAAAELQAMDRVHRVGQVRKVRVVRFVTRRTVEERVADLQRKKTAMITAAMQQQLTKQDIDELFRDPILN